ncbi:hypothetical protein BDZ45DRAFT_315030 [Acephala macrosclerotiorum]|nr:hypothetical protein BDZ45DRAFT_315030 [Acephala macrosclerotiorum]
MFSNSMATPSLKALPMSSSKSELLKHLNLPLETYALMAKEAKGAYFQLTSNKDNFKTNSKQEPPYDWGDIQERPKDDAVTAIVNGGDKYTSYYWGLAVPSDDCPNWIAKWFLYHEFRYKDKRNGAQAKGSKGKRPASSSSGYTYHTSQPYDSADIAVVSNDQPSGNYYDPVRDV